ncbi:MAG: hypothetical protein O3A10_05285 [Chloroflexi bacterium]|nr:hypothetical protein [Chloroflexota bacterium]
MTSPFLSPDEWFETAFEDGKGFGDWLAGSNIFGENGPPFGWPDSLWDDPRGFWSALPDVEKELLRGAFIDAVLRGETPSPRPESPPHAPARPPPTTAPVPEIVIGDGLERLIEQFEEDLDGATGGGGTSGVEAASGEEPSLEWVGGETSGDEPLPGLEDDDAPAEPAARAPAAESRLGASAVPEPRRRSGNWTDQELQDWFDNEYGGEAQLEKDWGRLPSTLRRDLVEEYEYQEETDLDSELPVEQRSAEARIAEALLAGDGRFSGVDTSIKAGLRDFVESGLPWKSYGSRHDATVTADDGSLILVDSAAAEEDAARGPSIGEERTTPITLPDGSVITETSDDTGVIRRELTDRGGTRIGRLRIDAEPLDEAAAARLSGVGRSEPATPPAPAAAAAAAETPPPPLSAPITPSPTSVSASPLTAAPAVAAGGCFGLSRNLAIALIAGAAFIAAIALFAIGGFGSGGIAGGTYATSDPIGDYFAFAAEFESIADPTNEGDINAFFVALDQAVTVTVSFA